MTYSFEEFITALYSGDAGRFGKVDIVPRDVVYLRALIEQDVGISLDYETTERYMREEGFAPAKEYGIPDWYRRKYGVK